MKKIVLIFSCLFFLISVFAQEKNTDYGLYWRALEKKKPEHAMGIDLLPGSEFPQEGN